MIDFDYNKTHILNNIHFMKIFKGSSEHKLNILILSLYLRRLYNSLSLKNIFFALFSHPSFFAIIF